MAEQNHSAAMTAYRFFSVNELDMVLSFKRSNARVMTTRSRWQNRCSAMVAASRCGMSAAVSADALTRNFARSLSVFVGRCPA